MQGNPFLQQRRHVLLRTAAAAALAAASLVPPIRAEVGARQATTPALALDAGARVADGVTRHRVDVSSRADLPQPLAVHALALDPRLVDLTTALALGRRQGRATVADAARREGAVAAVNAGFFALASGDPTGVLRVDGDLVSDGRLMRGAVAITAARDGLRLTFDRVRVRTFLDVRVGRDWRPRALDGVDAVRRLGGATLYTPRFGAETGTPPSGVEWTLTLEARPSYARTGRLATSTHGAVVSATGKSASPIPSAGAVVSFGGEQPPAPLDALRPGVRVRVRQTWETETAGDAETFARADDVVGGAGLLLKDGRTIDDWAIEETSESLRTVRHPRTMIGVDRRGAIWLVTVDGRQPGYSTGVTMPELQRLARALGLTDALNLDGGGSTTMVVNGEVVNRPSDPTGPRTVSDVLLVRPRPGPRPRGPA